jgi:hypothetical protein
MAVPRSQAAAPYQECPDRCDGSPACPTRCRPWGREPRSRRRRPRSRGPVTIAPVRRSRSGCGGAQRTAGPRRAVGTSANREPDSEVIADGHSYPGCDPSRFSDTGAFDPRDDRPRDADPQRNIACGATGAVQSARPAGRTLARPAGCAEAKADPDPTTHANTCGCADAHAYAAADSNTSGHAYAAADSNTSGHAYAAADSNPGRDSHKPAPTMPNRRRPAAGTQQRGRAGRAPVRRRKVRT